MLRQQRKCITGRSHLVRAEEQALLAFALAAAWHVEAHADIAELLEHGGRPHHVVGGHAAAEAVQNDEGGATFASLEPLRDADDSRQLETFRGEARTLLGHRYFSDLVVLTKR